MNVGAVSAISSISKTPYIPPIDTSNAAQMYGLSIAYNLITGNGRTSDVSTMDYRPGSADNTSTGVGADATDTAIAMVMLKRATEMSTLEGMLSPNTLLSDKKM